MDTMNNLPPTSFWQGERVRLRAIEPSDWETYFAWNLDDEQSRALYFIPFPQSQKSVKQFAEKAAMRKPEADNFRFVIENSEHEVVGQYLDELIYGLTKEEFVAKHGSVKDSFQT